MAELPAEPALGLSVPAEALSKPKGAAQLLLIAFGWFCLSIVVCGVIAFGFGLANLAYNRGGAALTPIQYLILIGVSECVLMLGAFRQAKFVGVDGNRREGLGLVPIRRVWLLAVLIGILLVIHGLSWFGRTYLLQPPPVLGVGDLSIEATFFRGDHLARMGIAVVVVVLSPVAEEMFFCGWLWTGLRHFWVASETMLVTAALWLLTHADNGVSTMIHLIPLAITLSVARHYCASLWASISLHGLHNLMTIAAMGLAYGW